MKKVSPILTPQQDQQLGEIATHVRSLFHEKAEQWLDQSALCSVLRKSNGSAFAQTLVFGFLDQPEASYTDVQQTTQLQAVEVSPQAIEERMTPQAAALMRHLLEEMVAMVVNAQEYPIPLLQSFLKMTALTFLNSPEAYTIIAIHLRLNLLGSH